jgi:hypothetical protein
MSKRSTFLVASWLFVLATGMSAQGRFEVLAQNAVAEVPDLRILSIRDTQLSECYTVFIIKPPVAPDAVLVTTPDEAVDPSVQRIREAAEERDRRLKELKARANARPRLLSDPTEAARWYEAGRRKIDGEYDDVLRTQMPSSYPWASATPGMRSGAWEDSADAGRRAIIGPNHTSADKALTNQFSRLEALLKLAIETPRLAAAGPMRCAGNVDIRKPIP